MAHDTVLVVDDDPEMLQLYAGHLYQTGYTVIAVRSGEEALTLYDSNRPELVILDADMPTMDGFDTCIALRKRTGEEELPILIVTTMEDNASVVRAFAVGADDYITKPVHWEVLRQRMRHLLRGLQAHRSAREIQEALLHQEQQYRTIVEVSQEGIWRIDATGATTFTNQKMAQLLGCTVEQMMGRSFLEFIAPNARENALFHFKNRRAGVVEQQDIRFHRLDGGEVWVILSTSPLHDEQGRFTGVLAMAADITIRKTMETELRTSRNNFESIFEQANDGILLLGSPSGHFFMANARFCEMLGCNRSEVPFLVSGDFSPTGTRIWDLDVFQNHEEGKVNTQNDVPLFCWNGAVVFTDITLSEVTVDDQVYRMGLFRDATQRRRSQAIRVADAERLRRLMELNRRAQELTVQELCDQALEIAVLLTHSQAGFLILLNEDQDTFSQISWSQEVRRLGISKPPLTPFSLAQAGAWADCARQLKPVVYNEGLPPFTRRGLPLGHFPVSRYLSVPVLDGDRARMILGVFNKTENYEDFDNNQLQAVGNEVQNFILRRCWEETLEQAKEKAETANRAKADFLATMSHEIRTPMNGVLGMADLILRTSLTEQQRHYIETIHRSGRTLLRIINDILDLSKINAGGLSLELLRFDIYEVIDDIKKAFQKTAKARPFSFSVCGCKNLPIHLIGDPFRLRQILFNLVGNAIKFTEEGSVVLAVRVIEEREADVLVRFEVCDTGIGISPEYQIHLFQAFSQEDPSISRKFGGTGLGLAITQKLVVMMGGVLDVKSEAGRGSTFGFVLRFGKQQEGDRQEVMAFQAARRPITPDNIRFKGHILLVEDNLVNQEVAAATLAIFGCQVTLANNGQQALIEVDRAKPAFDAIFMDCEMPLLDGYETTRRLRQREIQDGLEHIPIIALTAHVLEQSRKQCHDAGMDHYLRKPFSQEELGAVLYRWLPSSEETGTNLEDPKTLESDPASWPRISQKIQSVSNFGHVGGLSPTFPVLDQIALGRILLLEKNGHQGLLCKLVEHYLVRTPELLAELGSALERNDSEAVRVAAHTLKSSSLTMGVAHLADLGRTMESEYANLALVKPHFRQARSVFAEAEQALNNFCLSI
ncbi:MAG: response regulator [Magnetococcales bacterium]|nr:response regulator [Magnetococcales bacterium]